MEKLLLQKIIELFKTRLRAGNIEFITPPKGSVTKTGLIYCGEAPSASATGYKGASKNKAKRDFNQHFTTNLKLKYTDTSTIVDETAILRAVVGNLYFISPLEGYARRTEGCYIQLDYGCRRAGGS